ncbi:MAG: acyl-CoA thioesterase [Betaproteobacteria bacterium]|nr:acyl-CoA thioesterase [Betaproteobacteria bacterium]
MADSKARPGVRADYKHFLPITTRWADNDAYGHVNNVVYYAYFDTVVNEYLISQGMLDVEKSPVIGLVVETGCKYFSSIAFPDRIAAGVRVAKLGNSSVRYEIALFRDGGNEAVAEGHFVHVYVDRQSRRPVALPQPLRDVLSRIAVTV